jgi:hypothetical protein
LTVKKKRSPIRASEEQMGAKEKIKEADYFLRQLYRARSNAFLYHISAFLSAWRSVLDVMLFDFAQMYSLGFDSKDRIDDEGFEIAARATKQKKALGFLAWWRRQIEHVSKSPLYRARNMIVHRGISPLTYAFPLGPLASFPPSNRLVIETIPVRVRFIKDGFTLTPKSIGPLKFLHPPIKGVSQIEAVFEDFPTRKAADVCKEALDQMRSIVEIAEREYWRPKQKKKFAETMTTIRLVRKKRTVDSRSHE